MQREVVGQFQIFASVSFPAALYTSPAAPALSMAIPSPTSRSGQTESVKTVTSPARIMAALANTSFRAERKAARPRLPP